MKKWLLVWGVIVLGVVTLGFVVVNLFLDTAHNTHEEVNNRLVRLDDRIERSEQFISTVQDFDETVDYYFSLLESAKHLRAQAEIAWFDGHYAMADEMIEEANDKLDRLVMVGGGTNWWLIGGLLGAILIVLTAVLGRRIRELIPRRQ